MAIEAIRGLISGYPEPFQPIRTPLLLAGGLSGASVWRLESAIGPLIARGWPPGFPESQLDFIDSCLQAARGLGYLAVPLANRFGQTRHTILGRSWELTPFLPGRPQLDPSLHSLQLGFAGLAEFHRQVTLATTIGPSPALVRRIDEARLLLDGGLAGLIRAVARRPDDSASRDARAWLALAPRVLVPILESALGLIASEFPLQPILGDPRPDHLLFDDNRLTGLIDYGAMTTDAVAVDLARLLVEWVGPDPERRVSAISAYAHIRALSEGEIALIEPLERLATVLAGAHWLRWYYLEGRPIPVQTVADRLRAGLPRLEALASRYPVTIR